MKTLTIEEASRLAIDKMVRHGIPLEQAEVAAPLYIEGELCGRPSHGLRHLFNNLEQFRVGDANRRPLQVLNETPFSALVDGGYQHAYYINVRAMELAIHKARATGIGLTALRNSGGSGLISYYTRKIAEAGFIGLALAGTPASVVPHGGQEPLLGTNPVSVAVPRRQAPPVFLDMATSAGTFNQILQARLSGASLPPGIAIGPDGQPTINPHEALNEHQRARLLPLAGHKGYGLGLVIALLTGAATGSHIGTQTGYVHDPDYFQGWFLAYRPDLFVSLETFYDRTDEFVADLLAIPPAPGHNLVRLPGEESERKRKTALVRGSIDIEEATYEFLLS